MILLIIQKKVTCLDCRISTSRIQMSWSYMCGFPESENTKSGPPIKRKDKEVEIERSEGGPLTAN